MRLWPVPDRKVLCLTADGSGMYTLQALWTMAREGLDVTIVIFANRDYAVLKREFSYLGVGEPGRRALDMFEIGRPDLDWVHLAKGMGVPGTRVTSLEGFAQGAAGRNGKRGAESYRGATLNLRSARRDGCTMMRYFEIRISIQKGTCGYTGRSET